MKATGITPFARIVAICDAYENATSAIPEDRSLPGPQALKQVLRGRGTLYDNELANQFAKMVGLYPPGTIVELMNGSVGIVIAKNYRYQHLPKVILVLDEKHNAVPERVIDLARTVDNRLDSGYLISAAYIDGTFDIYLKDYREKGLVLSFN